MMGAGGDKYKTCDPKYYGSGVKNCGNGIRGLEELLKKTEGKTDED
jgi:diaminopimelate epimerase